MNSEKNVSRIIAMFGCQKFYFFVYLSGFFCLSLITHDVCKDVPISWHAFNPRNIWILMKICYPFTSTLSHWGKLNFWICIYIFLICRIGHLLHLLILNTSHPAVTYATAEHQGRLFWITCKRLKLLKKAGRLQLIQNSTPSVTRRRQCCNRIKSYWAITSELANSTY